MKYIHRHLETTLKRYLKMFSIVGVTGPRQSGKSTMVQHLLGDKYEYVTFDDFRMLDLFNSDPERFIGIYSDKVVFDEVQKVPEIFNYLKLTVDRDRSKKGKFILTGSSQFAFLKGVSESLAGRIGLLTLFPFQYSEIPAKVREEAIFSGCYPEIILTKGMKSDEWYSSYIETYLTRDVRSLSNIGNLREFRQCIRLLALRAGQILSYSEISKEIGISVPTIKKWVSVLEASYIIFLLPPFHKSYGKRIIKSPKVYFYDTGLLSYLIGIQNKKELERSPLYGNIFENYVIAEIAKNEAHRKKHSELFYYRTNHNVEVDLIIERGGRYELIEVKSSETFRSKMIKSLNMLKERNAKAYLIYRGEKMELGKDICAINYAEYLKINC